MGVTCTDPILWEGWIAMGAMGQGNAREGYGEGASEKDLELGVMAFSRLVIQTALCA